jgi:hypothetical protein
MGLYMMLEMPVEVGLGLECDPGFSRSTARPLAYTWSDEVVFYLIAMTMQVLSKVLLREERLLFAGWPLATHWCQSYFRSLWNKFVNIVFSERPTSVSLKKKLLPEWFPLAESQVASWPVDALLCSRRIGTRVALC